jgi:3'-phosphoadenosine 5'-phosphosulfate (PAPS) 3'-phosphatase
MAANDEFTINIALLENNKPVIGVLYAPAIGELYVGIPGIGTWMEKDGRRKESIATPESLHLKMATSRFHDHPDAGIFAEANKVKELVPLGSALKFGRLAFAEVDIYPRLVGTYEWDTAAGQAILEASGGRIIDWETGKSLVYGKINRLNNRFIAFRSPYQYENFIF